jgi:Dyp-type peroxidase family
VSAPLELEEIQGLVLSGYPDRPAATFHLFAIVDPARARAWLARIADRIQFSEFLRTGRSEPPFLLEHPVNVAFTFEGLRLLELPAEALAGFESSFREGMAASHRSRQLGDDGKSAPSDWAWGGPTTDAVHGILCVYGVEGPLSAPVTEGDGVVLRGTLPTLSTPQKRSDRIEHFGYRDGIANPAIAGAPQKKRNDDVVPAGEVLLGYPNAYQKLPLTPRMRADLDPQELLPRDEEDRARRDFGRNGSYLVFRQLSQDVAAFEDFTHRAAKLLERDADWIGSRMVGRWKDGTPVTLRPERDPSLAADDTNHFFFHAHDDATGQRCPMGAHIRRTNPRDTTLPVPHDPALCGEDESTTKNPIRPRANQPRIIRRGRSYGPKLAEAPAAERGLHFLCLAANVRRQFEFVQSQWVNNPCFAGMTRDPDPLLATARVHPFPADELTIQGGKGQPARTLRDIPRLTEVRGGAYFFLPSRSALRYLGALDGSLPSSLERLVPNEREDALADAELHREKITRAKATTGHATRAFHVKSHGAGRARLVVRPDLPRVFRHGVFEPGRAYEAFVRFSSSAFVPAADSAADVHGIAIKLLGVEGPRAADFEARTQDFLLVDAPYLMVPNIAAALAFDRAQIAGGLRFATHLLTHPGELARVLSMTSKPRHPLSRPYSSVSPYRLGPHVVRWALRRASGPSLTEAEDSSDRLRKSLALQLARDGAIHLELCVEMRGGAPRPIEDGDVDWKGTLERIADLEIPADGFGSEANEALVETMSFNPWNALEAHRPLGNLNRARKLVYRAIYLHRTLANGKKPFEPE